MKKKIAKWLTGYNKNGGADVKRIIKLAFIFCICLLGLSGNESKATEYKEAGLYTQIGNGPALKYTNYAGEEVILNNGLTKFPIDLGTEKSFRNTIEKVEDLYGKYQFNYTGTGNSARGYGDVNQWRQLHTSKLSQTTQFSWIRNYIDYSNEKTWDQYYTTSGAALLEKLENDAGDTKVYKAYLTVAQVGTYLRNQNITLIGPNGKYIQVKMNKVYGSPVDSWYYNARLC